MPQTILKKKRNALKWLVLCEVIMQCVPFRGTQEAHPRTACITNIVLVCLQHFVQKKRQFLQNIQQHQPVSAHGTVSKADFCNNS